MDDHKHSFKRNEQRFYQCQFCDRIYFGVQWYLKQVITNPNTYIYTVEHERPMAGMTKSFDVVLGIR